MNQPRSASIVVSANRSQSRLRATFWSPSSRSATLSRNASSTSRSTWALRGGDDVVLHPGEHLAGVHAVVDAALEPAGDAGEHVLLAEPQHHPVVVRVEQPGLLVPLVAAREDVADPLDQLVDRGLLDHGLDREPGDEPDHPELVQVLELAGVVGQQALGHQLEQDVVVALERREDVGVGLEGGEPVHGPVALRRRTPPGTPGWCGSRARCRAPSCRPRATRARRRASSPSSGLAVLAENTSCSSVGHDLLREVQRVGPGEQREQPPLVDARSRGAGPPRAGRVASNWRRRSPYFTAIASATLAALMPAPPTHTRPWTSVPSIVKKRRFGFSMRLS